ncbi:MAG: 16S rRNA (uracil(1498)-N(3))-methyltransferase [Burkholderiaceae bacterium]
MRARLYLPDCPPGTVTLSDDQGHYLSRVLRLKPGDPLVVFDGRGQEASATVSQTTPPVTLSVGAFMAIDRESPQYIVVLQALCTGDKMDWVVQKSTELGAAEVWPIQTQRSLVRLDGPRAEKRRDHWQKVAEAAAAQCGRNRVPIIAPVLAFSEAITKAAGLLQQSTAPSATTSAATTGTTETAGTTTATTAWLLDPFATESLSEAPLNGRLLIAIGPEAGFTDAEESEARRLGFTGVRCGPRILRTETAAAAVLAAVATRIGEF